MSREFKDERIDYLYRAYRLGTMRAASESLDIAPSSISRHIASLEEELGIELIERGRHVVRLTAAGARVLEYYRDRASQRETLLTELDDLKGLRSGHLDVAIGTGLLRTIFAEALASFSKRYSQISISVRSLSSREIIPLVAEDECYFGVVMGPTGDPRVRVISSFSQPTCLICRPEHALAGRPSISLDELTGYRIILPDIGFGVRQQLAEIQEQTGRRIPVMMTSNSIQTILDCVVANLGATVLSVTSVPEHLTKGDLVAVPIDDPLLQASRVQIIKRSGRRLPASALALIDTLEHLLRNASAP